MSDSTSSSSSAGKSKTRKRKATDRGNHGGKRKSELRRFAQHCYEQFAAQAAYQNYPPHTNYVPNMPQKDDDVISLNASGELFSDDESNSLQVPLNFETMLKEPSVSKTTSEHIELLNSIQHLDCPEWSDVRYSDVQKNYCTKPGFVELDCNDEIKPFDRNPNLIIAERSYAALTLGLVKQREATKAGFESLLSWAVQTDDLSASSLKNKINEIFIEGDYNKISADILQICCGHRADIIEQRRDSILRSVKDKFIRANLRKIPPTIDSIFNKESFSNTLEKAGGVGKIFWPNRSASQKPNWTATQAGPSNAKPPAQGYREPVHKYGRSSSNQPTQGFHTNFFQPQPGPFPVPMYYPPPQGFGFPYQSYNPPKRFTQNQTRLNENVTARQRHYDDSRGKIGSRNNSNSQRGTKTFRSQRKF